MRKIDKLKTGLRGFCWVCEVNLIGEIKMIARNQIPVVVMSSLALLIVFLLGCSSDSQSEKSTETTSSQDEQSGIGSEEDQAKPLGPGKFSETGK